MDVEVGPGGVEIHVGDKEPLVNSLQRVLESSIDESSSDDEGCEAVWFTEEPTLEDDAALNREVLSLPALPVVAVAGETPRLVIPAIPNDLPPLLRTDLVETGFVKMSLPVQDELAVAATAEEEIARPLEPLPLVLFDGAMGEESSSPLTCTPLSMVGPPVSSQAMKPLGDGIDALSHGR
jgi:hypothetical protein